jgi:multidrug efflux pump subunit AcrA (membrane-fusion protein)
MRLAAVSVLTLIFGIGLLVAQEGGGDKKPKDSAPAKEPTLEELLAKAVKDNPDIRVAESKVREAEAELSRARLTVMQKVVKLHHEINAHKALVAQARRDLDRVLKLAAARAIAQEEVIQVQNALQVAQANLAKAEAELPFLLGKQPALMNVINSVEVEAEVDSGGIVRLWDIHTGKALGRPIASTMAEKIRKSLDTPIQLKLEKTPLDDVLEYVRQLIPEVNILRAEKNEDLGRRAVTARFTQPVPFGAAAQWLEDEANVRFVVRDYGIVVTDAKNIPPGAMLLHDFWKSDSGKKIAPKN